MMPHERRVVEEYNNLVDKLNSLRTFLERDRPEFVTELQWDLMVQQYGLMAGYANVLSKRIDTFTTQLTEQHKE